MKKQLHQKNQKEKIMIDFILEQLVTWWQFTVVGVLIIAIVAPIATWMYFSN